MRFASIVPQLAFQQQIRQLVLCRISEAKLRHHIVTATIPRSFSDSTTVRRGKVQC